MDVVYPEHLTSGPDDMFLSTALCFMVVNILFLFFS